MEQFTLDVRSLLSLTENKKIAGLFSDQKAIYIDHTDTDPMKSTQFTLQI